MRLISGTGVMLAVGLLCAYSYLYTTGKIELPATTTITTTEVVESSPEQLTEAPFPQATRVSGITAYISADSGLATGVVIDRQTILTVAHVVGKQKIVMVDVGRYKRRWVPASVVGMVKATGEDIIILQIVGDIEEFYNKKNFKIGTGIKIPRWLVTPKGVFDWNPGIIVPGDSGGAVLNLDGDLIGLVTGYITHSRKNVATLFR